MPEKLIQEQLMPASLLRQLSCLTDKRRIAVSSSAGDVSTGVRREGVRGSPCNSLEQCVPPSCLGAFQCDHHLLNDQISSKSPLYTHENLRPLSDALFLHELYYVKNTSVY